jgi:hypothetical protein
MTWWQPDRPVGARGRPGSPVAFGGLVAFTTILLLRPQSVAPALRTLRLALVAGVVAIAAHLVDCTVRRRPIAASHREIMIALALLGWATTTIPFSLWPGGSVAVLTDQYLKAVTFFWLIATLVTTPARLRAFAWTLVLCSIPLASVGIFHFHAEPDLSAGVSAFRRIEGYSGLSGNPNDLALTLNLIVPLAGALLIVSRGVIARILTLTALILDVTGVIVTFSRAGFLTLVAIVMLSIAIFVRRCAPAAVATIVVASLTVALLLPAGYAQRLSTITDIDADLTGSARGRWSDYQVAARHVVANPMIGAGIGQDILALDQLRDRATWRSVHNAYLQCAVDLGLPGMLLFVSLLAASLRAVRQVELRTAHEPALRELSIVAAGVRVTLAAFAVAAFFHPVAYQFYFFCVAGLAAALKNVYVAESGAV